MKLFEDKYFIEAKLRSLKSPFNNIAKTAVFEDVLYKCCLNNLTEGLIKSYPYDFVVRSLNQYGHVDGYNKDQGIIYLKTKENSKTIINNISKYLYS